MKYYLHDSNSFNDEKISQLYMKFGYEGLGLFYTILEKLSGQEKPIKTDVLKSQLKVGKRLEKCWSFMEEIGILSSNNGETFNKQLLNFSEKYKIKKQENAKRILEWRERQALIENVTDSESVRNAPKVKLSKVKVLEDINNKEREPFVFTFENLNKFFEVSPSWKEKICITFRIELKDLNSLIETFKNIQELKTMAWPTQKEALSHFINWLQIQIRNAVNKNTPAKKAELNIKTPAIVLYNAIKNEPDKAKKQELCFKFYRQVFSQIKTPELAYFQRTGLTEPEVQQLVFNHFKL